MMTAAKMSVEVSTLFPSGSQSMVFTPPTPLSPKSVCVQVNVYSFPAIHKLYPTNAHTPATPQINRKYTTQSLIPRNRAQDLCFRVARISTPFAGRYDFESLRFEARDSLGTLSSGF